MAKKSAHLKPYQWKKGQSGNPRGRVPGRYMSDVYRDLLNSRIPKGLSVKDGLGLALQKILDSGPSIAELVVFGQITEAIAKRSTSAASEIANRTDGRPMQAIEIEAQADITITRKGEQTTVKLKPDGNGRDGNGHE